MKKIILGVVLSGLMSGSVFANEDLIAENDRQDQVNQIFEDMKNKDITLEDLREYSNNLKNKMAEGVVNYFNEIESSLELILSDGENISDNLKDKAVKLKEQIAKTVEGFNLSESQENFRNEFEKISNQYVEIMKEYKEVLEDKIKSHQSEKVDDKK